MKKEISPEKIDKNVFEMIGKDWMLISAGTPEKSNVMTASWGGLGVLWNKNVAFSVIRPQRYTKEFIDKGDTFALSFFDESYRDVLTYCGRISGRDEDKIAKTGLTAVFCDGAPYFEEAKLVLICKKLYASPLLPEGFAEKDLIKANYAASDFHTLYVGEIIKVLAE